MPMWDKIMLLKESVKAVGQALNTMTLVSKAISIRDSD